jgi:hypothetical protein
MEDRASIWRFDSTMEAIKQLTAINVDGVHTPDVGSVLATQNPGHATDDVDRRFGAVQPHHETSSRQQFASSSTANLRRNYDGDNPTQVDRHVVPR